MEAMRLTVEDIRRNPDKGILTARVGATSCEAIHGTPRAILQIVIRVEDPRPKTEMRVLRCLARDQATWFLDIA
ncbi:MAG: hypothetical protein GJU76_07655 [Gallionella sp.]|jgi:hypothetical protein|nr:hypothetical protein [Gallionella sp.]